MLRIALILSLLLSLAFLPVPGTAQTSSNVVVSFTTTNSTPLNPGFAGFCTELQASAVEYYDTNFQQMAATLSPGWLRYPGGSMDDAFAWTNGLTLTNWFTNFPSWETNLLWPAAKLGNGKGGLKFSDFAAMCAERRRREDCRYHQWFHGQLGNSAGAFAAYALSNHIPVAVWELCNEPYTLAGTAAGDFFLNATDYVAQMKPYRDAIKAADSNAVVAIYFNDAGYPEPNTWDNDLKNYTDKYWDAVVYHHYPALPTNGVTFADLMALDNWQLASNTTARMTNYLIPDNNPNVTFLISEFAPARGDGAGGNYPPTTTLYGGIYAAEYLLRLSTLPQMSFVGPYQLLDAAGIDQTNTFYQRRRHRLQRRLHHQHRRLAVRLFLERAGLRVVGGGLGADPVHGGLSHHRWHQRSDVPMDTNGIATIPAIYAQAYQGGNGKRYVVLTNKGSNAVPVQITQDGVALTNQFLETFVTGSDPSATNSPPQNSPVQIQSDNRDQCRDDSRIQRRAAGMDGVQRAATCALAVTVSNSTQNCHWAGLTNVIYNVQGATNLLSTWTTLGRVANTATNFSFTNWNSGPQQFYRLVIP